MAAFGTVVNVGCRNQNKYQDKEERANGKNDHECAGAIGTDGHKPTESLRTCKIAGIPNHTNWYEDFNTGRCL